MSEADVQKYLVSRLDSRLDSFEAKLETLFERFDGKLESHTQKDSEQFTEISDKLYEMNGTVSGLRVKSSIFGLVGGLLAGILVSFKSMFN